MPEEIFVLSLFSILAGTGLLIYVISLVASYAKRRQQGTGAEGALRTSELEAMLRRIVREELQDSMRSGTEDVEGELAGSDRDASSRRRLGPRHVDAIDDLDDLERLDDLDIELDDDLDETRRVRVRRGGSSGRGPRVR